MAPKPELSPGIEVLDCGLCVILICFALSHGHQQNILGMSRQTGSVSIVFTKGRGGFGISVKG